MNLNVVLVEPEIPQNTGNIARTCAATGTKLHLVRPLGFSVSDKYLKRAGLDYWESVEINYYDNIDQILSKCKKDEAFFVSTKAKRNYAQVSYPNECYLFFGKESKGLPEKLLFDNYENCVRIPMLDKIRSLNLSNSVAILVYEVLKQKGFANLKLEGSLKNYSV